MTHLRKIMLEELERRNYAQTTISTYIQTDEDFARYFKRAPPTNSVQNTSVSTKHICSARGNSPHAPSRNGWPHSGSSSFRRLRKDGVWPIHLIRRRRDTCPAY